MQLRDNRQLVRLAAALATLVVALAVGACGGDGDRSESNSSAPGNGADLAFVERMVPHHESAIDMAAIAQQRGQSDFVKQLADDIVKAQQREIVVMNAVKADLTKGGVEPSDLGMSDAMAGMNMDDSVLETANPFDREFIDLMVPHHQGAIRMARVELARGESPVLKELAQDIIDAQASEIGQMNTFRQQRFGAVSPAGGAPTGDESNPMDHSDGSMGAMDDE